VEEDRPWVRMRVSRPDCINIFWTPEEATTGKSARERKPKRPTAADAPEPKAKMPQMSKASDPARF
jgi:hypothetical protein